jgi:hypothetical protein
LERSGGSSGAERAGGALHIEVSVGAGHALKIAVEGLSQADSSELITLMKSDGAFVQEIERLVEKAQGRRLAIVLPASVDGEFQYQKLKFF